MCCRGHADLINAGAHVVKVGVGAGRSHDAVVAGYGMPQLTAVMECASARPHGVAIVAAADPL